MKNANYYFDKYSIDKAYKLDDSVLYEAFELMININDFERANLIKENFSNNIWNEIAEVEVRIIESINQKSLNSVIDKMHIFDERADLCKRFASSQFKETGSSSLIDKSIFHLGALFKNKGTVYYNNNFAIQSTLLDFAFMYGSEDLLSKNIAYFKSINEASLIYMTLVVCEKINSFSYNNAVAIYDFVYKMALLSNKDLPEIILRDADEAISISLSKKGRYDLSEFYASRSKSPAALAYLNISYLSDEIENNDYRLNLENNKYFLYLEEYLSKNGPASEHYRDDLLVIVSSALSKLNERKYSHKYTQFISDHYKRYCAELNVKINKKEISNSIQLLEFINKYCDNSALEPSYLVHACRRAIKFLDISEIVGILSAIKYIGDESISDIKYIIDCVGGDLDLSFLIPVCSSEKNKISIAMDIIEKKEKIQRILFKETVFINDTYKNLRKIPAGAVYFAAQSPNENYTPNQLVGISSRPSTPTILSVKGSVVDRSYPTSQLRSGSAS